MVVYRHTILLRRIKNYFLSIGTDKLLFIGLSIGFFLIILMFSGQIINTINDGLSNQSKFDRVTADVKELETENARLKYLNNIYKSDGEKETEYRVLQNMKKEDEDVYIISLPNRVSPTPTPQIENQPASAGNQQTTISTKKEELSNWEKWIVRIF